MEGNNYRFKELSAVIIGSATVFCLYLVSRQNYLLFHAIVELFSVVVACCIFMIAWNARRFMANDYLLFVGIASLSIAAVDFLHMLAYKNMGVFGGGGANLPTQLWIVGRYLESFSLLLAPLFVRRRLHPSWAVAGYAIVTAIFLATLFVWPVFPVCFVEGEGLTPFKKWSEYLVIALLLAGLALLRHNRKYFDPGVFRLLAGSILLLAGAELLFTLYVDVFGMTNMAGHIFKCAAFYLIYRALVQTGLSRPYELLFRELKQSEERYRFLYQNTPVMLHSIDREGRLVNVSNYWLEQMGYERNEVLGHKSTEFMTEASRRFVSEALLPKFLRAGRVKEMPYQMVRKDGEVRDMLITASAEMDASGEIIQSLSVMIDVTERTRAERENEILTADLEKRNIALRDANCELEAFTHTVSHDLRGPLTSINGYSQVILELFAPALPAECKGYVESIYQQTLKMNQLINTLLDFSRVTQARLQHEQVDLSGMAKDILANLLFLTPERQVNCKIAEGVVVAGDANLLRVALENLLGNAWKYSSRRDVAIVEFGMIEGEGRQVCFVRDNGVGFAMEQAAALFETFQRLSTAVEFEGTGIGLATVQRIIQRHGGRIWAEGVAGEGATFYFTLPDPPAS